MKNENKQNLQPVPQRRRVHFLERQGEESLERFERRVNEYLDSCPSVLFVYTNGKSVLIQYEPDV